MKAAASPVQEFLHHVIASLGDDSFISLILSGGTAPDGPRRILGRWIRVKEGPRLSLTLKHKTHDLTRNLRADEVPAWLHSELAGAFRSALLRTATRDWQLSLPLDREPWLISHRPSVQRPPSRQHDHAKQTLLDDSAADWLWGLGVCDDRGRVNPGMADKHRQIHRYLEIFSHLAKDCGWAPEPPRPAKETQQPVRRVWIEGEDMPTELESEPAPPPVPAPLTIADMGCGKGYLTFAVWHLLRRRWGLNARILGVETRPKLVRQLTEFAAQLEPSGLEFLPGDIASVRLPRLDALIALHACDTATDDALRRGVELGAKLILLAPCCHQAVRPQLGRPVPLTPVLEHGIMAERMAEWVTDGLRALFLEWAGYRTKLIEFVGTEHTPKNLMLVGIRTGTPFTHEPARRRIHEFKSFFGLTHHALDPLLEKPEKQTPPATDGENPVGKGLARSKGPG
jgi:SAM-dependent methyltransferase